MKMTLTTEQKWVIGALAVLIAAAAPALFMNKSRAASPDAGPAGVIQPQGDPVPILETDWSPRGMSGDEQQKLEENLKVDINHADKEALMTLPGVGPGSAEKIIAYRDAHGCFQDVEEVQKVKGFAGQNKFDSIKDHIRIELKGCVIRTAEEAEPADREKKSGKSRKKSSESSGDLLNINTASVEEIDALPGVGKSTAKKIVDYRNENGPFGSVDDLENVPGIRKATFNKIKDLVTTN